MDAQVAGKTRIPDGLKQGLGKLFDMRQHIYALRKIQTSVGYGQFGSEKDIAHLLFIASQFALECIERVCCDTEKDVTERFTTPSSEDIKF